MGWPGSPPYCRAHQPTAHGSKIDSAAKNFLIVAGEVSGDHHAAPLMAALKAHNPEHSFWGLGGDHMLKEGLDSLYHVRDLSVTGFIEVIKHLRFFNRVMSDVLEACSENKPDAAILLDYPGFNLRLGMKLKALGIPVYYYISPQVWAWKKGRVKTMRQFIKRLFVIFPFEVDFYKEHDIPVSFVGHPLVEKQFELPEKQIFFAQHGLDPQKPLLAVLPGSRRNEVERLSAPLVDAIQRLKKETPALQIAVAGLSSLPESFYSPFSRVKDLALIFDDPYPLVSHANAAIVASGTASLEAAYLGTPLVVVYKISWLSYLIGKLLVDIDHLAMPNLILGERAIPELIQGDATGKIISAEIQQLLNNQDRRDAMLEKLAKVQSALGQPGCAGQVAMEILEELG